MCLGEVCFIIVSLPVLSMAEQSNGYAGGSSVFVTVEQLEQALRDNANDKRDSALDKHGQRFDEILAQLGNLKQLFPNHPTQEKRGKYPHSGRSEEAKKARIAPGKLRSCLPWNTDVLINHVDERSSNLRDIQTVLAYPARL